MSILSWILLGLIAGALVKAIMPGRQGGGWISTILLGIAGAMVGGWIGGALGFQPNEGFFSFSTWIFAILGGILVTVVWQFVAKRIGSGAKA